MSRFRFSVIALAVIVLVIVTIGACARQAAATPRAQSTGRLVTSTSNPVGERTARLVGTAVDSEWAVASHVNW